MYAKDNVDRKGVLAGINSAIYKGSTIERVTFFGLSFHHLVAPKCNTMNTNSRYYLNVTASNPAVVVYTYYYGGQIK